jgi:hypothetical protein
MIRMKCFPVAVAHVTRNLQVTSITSLQDFMVVFDSESTAVTI